jgi:hypothetical protein
MFNGPGFPKPLEEDTFNSWLETGRLSKLSYKYLLIIWDEYDARYLPVYATDRDELDNYQAYKQSVGRESLIAAYDLYSESKIS